MPYQFSNAPSSIGAPMTHLQKAMLKKNAEPTRPTFAFTSFPSWPWTSEGQLGRKDNIEGFKNSHGHGERKQKKNKISINGIHNIRPWSHFTHLMTSRSILRRRWAQIEE